MLGARPSRASKSSGQHPGNTSGLKQGSLPSPLPPSSTLPTQRPKACSYNISQTTSLLHQKSPSGITPDHHARAPVTLHWPPPLPTSTLLCSACVICTIPGLSSPLERKLHEAGLLPVSFPALSSAPGMQETSTSSPRMNETGSNPSAVAAGLPTRWR